MNSETKSRNDPDHVIAMWLALGIEAVVLVFVAQVYYGSQDGKGIPAAPILSGVITAGVLWGISLVETRREKKVEAKSSVFWSLVQIGLVFLVGLYLPLQLAVSFPLPILLSVPTWLGALILVFPAVLLLGLVVYRIRQARVRRQRSLGDRQEAKPMNYLRWRLVLFPPALLVGVALIVWAAQGELSVWTIPAIVMGLVIELMLILRARKQLAG